MPVPVPETSGIVADSLRQACDELQILEVRQLLVSMLITFVSSSLVAKLLYSVEIGFMEKPKIPFMKPLAPFCLLWKHFIKAMQISLQEHQ